LGRTRAEEDAGAVAGGVRKREGGGKGRGGGEGRQTKEARKIQDGI
jgi:hypothetical protein